jgi:glycosyltransferase involved in cell wall biosynthesis
LAGKLGLADRFVWHGLMPRDKAINMIHQSHIFVITSLKDLTSTVLLEALSQGAPVICPDHCGFSGVVTEDCGIKIAVKTPRQLVTDMAAAIIKLAQDENERQRLSRGAIRRVKDFSWDGKAERINSIYMRAHFGKNARG